MGIENFSDYYDKVDLDISQFNDDNNIKYSNIQPVEFTLVSLYNFIDVNLTDILELCDEYAINDEERPDTISQKLYGSEDLWWVSLLINRISYYDFPLSETNLNTLSEYLYEQEYKFNSPDIYYNYLKEINDLKRNISVIKEEYLYILLRKIFEYVAGRT